MDVAALRNDIKRRMEGAVEVLHKEFAGLRTGRAATSLLEPLVVEAYGSQMPLNQVGTVNAPDPRMLTVQVWDKGQVRAVERAIRESGLGLNPVVDGQLLRIPIPPLSEERRVELTKVAHKYAEESRIAVRNVRRHAMDDLKHAEKEGKISIDEHRDQNKAIQEMTDTYVRRIDEVLAHKEKEILQV